MRKRTRGFGYWPTPYVGGKRVRGKKHLRGGRGLKGLGVAKAGVWGGEWIEIEGRNLRDQRKEGFHPTPRNWNKIE